MADRAGTSDAAPQAPLTRLRRAAKQMVATSQFRWLSAPARRAWYYWRWVSEIRNVPAILLRYGGDYRAKPIDAIADDIFSRFNGMFRPFQVRAELLRLLQRAAAIRPRTVVEIGTARGGTLFLLSCVADPAAKIVSIDLPAGLYGGGYPAWKGALYRRLMGRGQDLRLIRGDSHKEATFKAAVRALEGAKVDLLFIDGDHTYAGAKQDFLRYRSLVRPGGLVVMHDIIENQFDKAITVAPLWREISAQFETEEIVDSYDQSGMGIGVIKAPAQWPSQA